MKATSLIFVMGLALFLGVLLMDPTSCAPVFDDLDTPSIFKEAGGLAAFAYSRKKQPEKKIVRNRMMPPTLNMSQHQRTLFGDNCEAVGRSCKYAEQCCTKVCLVATRRCAVVGEY
ncbi:uncharacterized protein LOC117585558 [Drosophila guanche]|nr:uncharacterized protein LOC117585558 [Drosophila guanche]